MILMKKIRNIKEYTVGCAVWFSDKKGHAVVDRDPVGQTAMHPDFIHTNGASFWNKQQTRYAFTFDPKHWPWLFKI